VQSRTFTRESPFRSSVAGSAIPFPFKSQQFAPFEPAGLGIAHPIPTAPRATTIAAMLNAKLTFPARDENAPARAAPSTPLMRNAPASFRLRLSLGFPSFDARDIDPEDFAPASAGATGIRGFSKTPYPNPVFSHA